MWKLYLDTKDIFCIDLFCTDFDVIHSSWLGRLIRYTDIGTCVKLPQPFRQKFIPLLKKLNLKTCLHQHHHHHHHQSLNHEGRWGTTDDFTTSFLHFCLFSTALWDFAELQACPFPDVVFPPLPLYALSPPPPFTVPCKMVLARPDERETWPYHFSVRLYHGQEVFVWSDCPLDHGLLHHDIKLRKRPTTTEHSGLKCPVHFVADQTSLVSDKSSGLGWAYRGVFVADQTSFVSDKSTGLGWRLSRCLWSIYREVRSKHHRSRIIECTEEKK